MKIKEPTEPVEEPPIDITMSREELRALKKILGSLSTSIMDDLGIKHYDDISSEMYHDMCRILEPDDYEDDAQ